MHDIEDQAGRQGPVDERPGEQLPDTRTHKPAQKDTTRAGSPRLSDAWKIGMIAGAALLILAIILAGVLSGNHVPSQSRNGSQPSSVSTTGANKLNVLPYPTATAIQPRTFTGHSINFTIANGTLFAATVDNAVYALRLNDGAVLWHQKIDGSASTQPFTLNGIVYVNSYAGQNGPDHVYALRASDGSILWNYTSPGYIYASPSSVDAGVIYLATPEGISAHSTPCEPVMALYSGPIQLPARMSLW
jgi:outer membrane protein assembly factor BamB